jgi:hypothetical protein
MEKFSATTNIYCKVSPEVAVDIVKACVVLHSFVRGRDRYKIEDAMTVSGLEDVPDGQSVWVGG